MEVERQEVSCLIEHTIKKNSSSSSSSAWGGLEAICG